jgi:hypothetical protein
MTHTPECAAQSIYTPVCTCNSAPRSLSGSADPTDAAHVAGVGGGWLPIETAERTRKARLVWVPERKSIFCVTWRKETDDPYYPAGWVIYGGEWRPFLQAASHWMPLPNPPVTL